MTLGRGEEESTYLSSQDLSPLVLFISTDFFSQVSNFNMLVYSSL